ncbi:MAG: hypothetical protein AB4352_03020 [Hormoscilla sp.]
MKIKSIRESEFNLMEGVRQIIVHDYSHKFAILDLGEKLGSYGMSWRSSSLKPIIKVWSEENAVWVGVDQQLACICLQSGRLLVSLPLTTYIVQIMTLDRVTAVLTEEEVLLFNPGGSIRFSEDLPDQGIGMSVVGEELAIEMLDGDSLTINTMTGVFKSLVPIGYR